MPEAVFGNIAGPLNRLPHHKRSLLRPWFRPRQGDHFGRNSAWLRRPQADSVIVLQFGMTSLTRVGSAFAPAGVP